MTTFKKGDSVRFKADAKDPDSGIDISNWQGRIAEFQDNGSILIELDSVTLHSMPESYIINCEENGYEWAEYYWPLDEVASAEHRDTLAEREEVYDEIAYRYRWAYLEAEGKDIAKVVGDSDDDGWEVFDKWENHFEEKLDFPFRAEVSEWSSHGSRVKIGDKVKVIGIYEADEHYGILVSCKFRYRKLILPLCDLTVVDKKSPQYDLVHLYAVWFANR